MAGKEQRLVFKSGKLKSEYKTDKQKNFPL